MHQKDSFLISKIINKIATPPEIIMSARLKTVKKGTLI